MKKLFLAVFLTAVAMIVVGVGVVFGWETQPGVAVDGKIFIGVDLLNVTNDGNHKGRNMYGANFGFIIPGRKERFRWELTSEFLKNLEQKEDSIDYGFFLWPRAGYEIKLTQKLNLVPMGGFYLGYLDGFGQTGNTTAKSGLDSNQIWFVFPSLGIKLEYKLTNKWSAYADLNALFPVFWKSDGYSHPKNFDEIKRGLTDQAHPKVAIGVSYENYGIEIANEKISFNEIMLNLNRLWVARALYKF
ncbi:MAG: hypothetical protein NTV77_02920 [Candidatus Azambacteria bacterium]|nr:hypothetical protein [Candidatus Azambacteria bacterium]